MIQIEEVLALHEIMIERFGGSHGVRDQPLLQSALNRPFQTFDGTDLYPTIYEKVAALIESVLVNHPFVDGILSYGRLHQYFHVGCNAV